VPKGQGANFQKYPVYRLYIVNFTRTLTFEHFCQSLETKLAAKVAKEEAAAKKAEKSISEKDRKLYEDGMACETNLSAAKESLLKTTDELNQKKQDFRRFLRLLQSTWSETETLKSQISTLQKQKVASKLEGAMAAEAGNAIRTGAGPLSTTVRILNMLGVVPNGKGASGSNSDKGQTPGSTQDESDW
jgi:hypothetical protein